MYKNTNKSKSQIFKINLFKYRRDDHVIKADSNEQILPSCSWFQVLSNSLAKCFKRMLGGLSEGSEFWLKSQNDDAWNLKHKQDVVCS